MSKVQSRYLLLLALVFSTAQAPTFQIWRGGSNAHEDLQATVLGSGHAASFDPVDMTAALLHEYAEDGDIKRFQLDEFYLPKLDVSLPDLFDWSDIDQAYLANAAIPDDAFGLDSTPAAAFRIAALDGAYALGAVGRPGGSGGTGGAGGISGAGGSSSLGDDASDSDASSQGQSGKGGSTGSNGAESLPGDSSNDDTQLADNGAPSDPILDPTQPPGDSTNITDPIEDPKPVPVPEPGALGLFALGLAGLRLAGRNKNRSG